MTFDNGYRPLRARLLIVLLLLFAGIAKANDDNLAIPTFSASYRGEVNGFGLENLGTRQLIKVSDNLYEIVYEANATIYSLEEKSRFTWQKGLPVPLHYQSEKSSFFKTRKTQVEFDWKAQRANYTHKKKQGQFTLATGVQDPLTGSLVLAQQVARGVTSIEYPEARDKDIEFKKFVVLGKTTLKTPLGDIKTYHVRRIHSDKDRQTEIWLHEQSPYILVKMRQVDEGDVFLLELTQLTIDTPARLIKK